MGVRPALLETQSLDETMALVALEIDLRFHAALSSPADGSERLLEAMRYAAIGGGKRIRPLLVHASGSLFDVPPDRTLRTGLAVECVHVHSLIHDDLPCMDDDDLRRSKPTVHVAFDEATAVLAGDALLAMSFEVLGHPDSHPSGEVRVELASTLAAAAGANGMAGGQMLDLVAEHPSDMEGVTRLQRLKTGALIAWSVEAGAILGEATQDLRTSLRGYAQALGLAFQIVDDLLDVAGNEQTVGKRVGKDAAQGKATFVTLLGPDRARRQAALLIDQAIEHLRFVGPRRHLLEAIARFVLERQR